MNWRKITDRTKNILKKPTEVAQTWADILSPKAAEIRQRLEAYWSEINVSELKSRLGNAWSGVADVYTSTSQSPHIQKHLRQVQGALSGTAAGIGAGGLLGGGGVSIVALGGAIGIPLNAITGLVGLLAGERGGRELDFLRTQWKGAAEHTEIAKEHLTQTPAFGVPSGLVRCRSSTCCVY